jgi:hypothetical protein
MSVPRGADDGRVQLLLIAAGSRRLDHQSRVAQWVILVVEAFSEAEREAPQALEICEDEEILGRQACVQVLPTGQCGVLLPVLPLPTALR